MKGIMKEIEGTLCFDKPDRVTVDKDGVSIYKGLKRIHFEIEQWSCLEDGVYYAELKEKE